MMGKTILRERGGKLPQFPNPPHREKALLMYTVLLPRCRICRAVLIFIDDHFQILVDACEVFLFQSHKGPHPAESVKMFRIISSI